MNPEAFYQLSLARIDDLRRDAAVNRLADSTAHVGRRTSSRRQWRFRRTPRPSMTKRFA
jgi:hypothetical protein